MPILYRRRLIPEECICLKNDKIILQNDNQIITSWQTLRPKDKFASGISFYILDKGWKISKFYNIDNEVIYIYCDIIESEYNEKEDSYIFTDLLADVIVENNGFVRVVDLDELASAFDLKIIDEKTISNALNKLNDLLQTIYQGGLQPYIELLEKYDDITFS